jgi:small-conductance mechanosensitive channel
LQIPLFMEHFLELGRGLVEWLEAPLFRVGNSAITAGALLMVLVSLILLYWLAALARRLIVRALQRTPMDIGAREAIGTLVRYLVFFFGGLAIIQSAGIDLTALSVFAGALGVGIGFGLQNIASNFISGLILLIERPVKVGDRVVVNNIDGKVVQIGARATTIITNDNIAIVVPNSMLIQEPVINWTRDDPRVRFKIPIGVAYGSDLRLVEKLLYEVAESHPDVLADPPPAVRLMAFGESAVEFELRVWSTTLVHQRGKLISELNFAIYDKFKEYGIEIPYPKRDLYLREGKVQVQIDSASLPASASGYNTESAGGIHRERGLEGTAGAD